MSSAGKASTGLQRERGATAIEFALLFPLLFVVLYAGITYGFVFFLQQRVNFAAQEAVRAAIAVDPSVTDYSGTITANASLAVTQSFTGGGAALPAGLAVPPSVTVSADKTTVQVTVTYSLTSPVLFPRITLPGFGPVPALPAALIGTATGRLS